MIREVVKGWFAKLSLLIGVPYRENDDFVRCWVDQNGLEWLEANQEDLDPKCVHSTGRGKHLLYRYPSDGAGRKTRREMALGVDTRGEGSYIIWCSR